MAFVASLFSNSPSSEPPALTRLAISSSVSNAAGALPFSVLIALVTADVAAESAWLAAACARCACVPASFLYRSAASFRPCTSERSVLAALVMIEFTVFDKVEKLSRNHWYLASHDLNTVAAAFISDLAASAFFSCWSICCLADSTAEACCDTVEAAPEAALALPSALLAAFSAREASLPAEDALPEARSAESLASRSAFCAPWITAGSYLMCCSISSRSVIRPVPAGTVTSMGAVLETLRHLNCTSSGPGSTCASPTPLFRATTIGVGDIRRPLVSEARTAGDRITTESPMLAVPPTSLTSIVSVRMLNPLSWFSVKCAEQQGLSCVRPIRKCATCESPCTTLQCGNQPQEQRHSCAHSSCDDYRSQ